MLCPSKLEGKTESKRQKSDAAMYVKANETSSLQEGLRGSQLF